MNHRCLIAVAIALAAEAALWAAQPKPSDPRFGEAVDVNVVNVDVFVADRNGRPVQGLQRGDFEILEDGKRVEVTNFEAFQVGGLEGNSEASPIDSAAPGAETAPEDRLSLVVFFDNANLRPENRARVLGQLRDFLGKAVGPKDQVMIVTHSLSLQVRLPFTSDTAKIQAVLDQIGKMPATGGEADSARRQALSEISSIRDLSNRENPLAGQLESPCAPRIVHPVENYARSVREEVIRSLSATKVLVNSLAGLPGQKALLHVSDGLPLTPGEELFQVLFEICGGGSASSGASGGINVQDGELLNVEDYKGRQALMDAQRFSTAKEIGQLAAHAAANRVTMYTIQATGLRGAASAPGTLGPDERVLHLPAVADIQVKNAQESLNALASGTGGRTVFDANDIRGDLAKIKEELGTYYSLAYSPAHSGDGRDHRIEVRVRKPGLRVRHRQSYRDKPAIEKVVDRTLTALYHGVGENPLGITVEVGEQAAGADGTWAVPVQLRIPLFKVFMESQQDQSYKGKLWLLVAVRDVKGSTSPMRQVEVPIHIPREQVLTAMGQFFLYELKLSLRPGEQYLGIAVRDPVTSTTSYLSQKVTVGEKDSSTR